MSNGAVGNLYARIMDAVLESSRSDFEESGVDSRTIDDMRKTWQSHLSDLQRAHFPWEPAPEPASASAPPASSAPSATPAPAAPAPTPQPETPIAASAAPAVQKQESAGGPGSQSNSQGGGGIKQESSFDTSFLNLPTTAPTGAYNQNPHYAHQRAFNNIQQKFGAQANQLASSNGATVDNSASQHPAPGYSSQPPAKRIKTEGSSVSNSQLDGTGDDPADEWRSIMQAQANLTPDQRASADHMMRNEARKLQRRLEGGGLLLPLDQQGPPLQVVSARSSQGPSGAGFDGADDSDDDSDKYPDEEDAINSDLDDSDDENVESALAGETNEGDVILCLYDKVQRVKNKWKCQLKDGVCTIDGRDYVFHKANGEFEW